MQAWRYIIQTSEHCRERMLWTHWLLHGDSQEMSWLKLVNLSSRIFLVYIHSRIFKIHYYPICHKKPMERHVTLESWSDDVRSSVALVGPPLGAH